MTAHKVVIGLGFGDEGKGMAVAHEVERFKNDGIEPVVVRFNGSAQCGHNVRAWRHGRLMHHCHQQFGSGSLLGARTVLSKGMLFSPVAIAEEATRLSATVEDDVMPWMCVDEACPVILPIHTIANRMLERARGDKRHGSTGVGVGVARACEQFASEHCPDMVVTTRTLFYPLSLERRMRFWQDWIEQNFDIRFDLPDDYAHDTARCISDGIRMLTSYGMQVCEDTTSLIRDFMDDGRHGIVFEGSQGILLDERYGWFPHVTYGDMTPKNARDIAAGRRLSVMGVTRTYQTRHGNGPMPTEGTCCIPEADGDYTEWTGPFRTGLLDTPTLAMASKAAGVDEIAVSHVDRSPGRCVTFWLWSKSVKGCTRDIPCGGVCWGFDEHPIIDYIERRCEAPVTVLGCGPTLGEWHDKREYERFVGELSDGSSF